MAKNGFSILANRAPLLTLPRILNGQMITRDQFSALEALFYYYNNELFDGQLGDCLLNLSRKNGASGYFSPNRWTDAGNTRRIHEISINPDTWDIEDEELHRTIVHEMCHMWQQDHGEPSRRFYHNKDWGEKMISVGLMPSSTGRPGGKTTGQHMSDYTIESGAFKTAFDKIYLTERELTLPYQPVKPKGYGTIDYENHEHDMEAVEPTTDSKQDTEATEVIRAAKKYKYSCPTCEINVWGKHGLELTCKPCGQQLQIID